MLVALFAIVVYTDWRWLRIPNVVTYPVMLIGLGLGAAEGVPGQLFVSGLADHLVALLLAFALAYPFYAAGGLKAGDAKMLMAIGAVRGVSFLMAATIYGALIGGVMALGIIAIRRARATPGETGTMRSAMKSKMPYGIALGLGGLLALALEAAALVSIGPP
ncbi:MAG TPA: A24 family peptidase [Candidatus Limnocylindria bacterium]|nr:A24 family peptidase [Candidatus Limnocylindria bacterium]